MSKTILIAGAGANQVGIFNKAFGYIYQVPLVMKKLREKSKLGYHLVHVVLYGSLAYWAFF